VKRRLFIQSGLVGLVGLSISPLAFSIPSGNQVLPGNWAWMNGSLRTPPEEWKRIIDRLLQAGIKGLLVNGPDELYQQLGPMCRQAGIQLHTWRWTINRGQYMEQHPDWYAVDRLGRSVVDDPPYVGYYRWLCPSRPEVRDLLVRDYTSLAAIPGVSGVHLDYVRYSDIYLPIGLLPKYNLVQDHEMPEYDYCYCTTCRSGFKERHGYDPLELPDPSKDPHWHQYRLDQLVDLVQAVVEAVHQAGSVITGAVFPTPEMSRTMVRQDWPRFNLDAYMPMLYHQFYLEPVEWIANCIREIRAEIGDSPPVFAGFLNRSEVFTPDVLARTFQQVKEAGGQGLSIFTAGSLTEEQLEALQRF
jgi:hypothetical protein